MLRAAAPSAALPHPPAAGASREPPRPVRRCRRAYVAGETRLLSREAPQEHGCCARPCQLQLQWQPAAPSACRSAASCATDGKRPILPSRSNLLRDRSTTRDPAALILHSRNHAAQCCTLGRRTTAPRPMAATLSTDRHARHAWARLRVTGESPRRVRDSLQLSSGPIWDKLTMPVPSPLRSSGRCLKLGSSARWGQLPGAEPRSTQAHLVSGCGAMDLLDRMLAEAEVIPGRIVQRRSALCRGRKHAV